MGGFIPPLASNIATSIIAQGANLLFGGSEPLDFFIGTSLTNPEIIFGDGSNLRGNPGTEIPEEFPFPGAQSAASHDFPGGTRTIQLMGAFPQTIRWKGLLLGGQAFSRAAAMDRLRINDSGNFLYLKYGPWQWAGYLLMFVPKARHQWLVEYEAEFEPFIDLTNTSQVIASKGSESLLTEVVNDLKKFVTTTTGLSADVLEEVGLVISAIGAAALAADPRAVSNAVAAATGPTSAVFIQSKSANPAAAAQVGDVLSQLLVLNQLFPVTPSIQTQVNRINPNLPALAAEQLGDQTQWPAIAAANGLLQTMPVGVFEHLKIPAAVTK